MHKPQRKTLLFGAVLGIAVIGMLGYGLWPRTAAVSTPDSTREWIENISVQTLAGEQYSLGDLRGKVVLVNFWATWCSGCRSEMPGFQAVYDAYRNQGFTILAFSVDETGPGTVRDFLREHGYNFPVAMVTAEATRRFGPRGVPVSYLIDQKGEIRETVYGVFHEVDLEAAVRELLAEGSGGQVAAD